jgi:hypothetical protein
VGERSRKDLVHTSGNRPARPASVHARKTRSAASNGADCAAPAEALASRAAAEAACDVVAEEVRTPTWRVCHAYACCCGRRCVASQRGARTKLALQLASPRGHCRRKIALGLDNRSWQPSGMAKCCCFDGSDVLVVRRGCCFERGGQWSWESGLHHSERGDLLLPRVLSKDTSPKT